MDRLLGSVFLYVLKFEPVETEACEQIVRLIRCVKRSRVSVEIFIFRGFKFVNRLYFRDVFRF